MIDRHYHIACLKKGQGIVLDGHDISVNLDVISESDHIFNDKALLARVDPQHYFFVSGGGTILINNRYLLVVRREETAPINPGKFSLFTGRAENVLEWSQPWRLVRELFEELTVFSDGGMLYPKFSDFQSVIDEVYQGSGRRNTTPIIPLERVPLSNGKLTVTHHGQKSYCEPAFCTVNLRNDINILFLFRAQLNFDSLTASDNESIEGSRRMIAAYDCVNKEFIGLPGSPLSRFRQSVTEDLMTEHLRAMLQALSQQL